MISKNTRIVEILDSLEILSLQVSTICLSAAMMLTCLPISNNSSRTHVKKEWIMRQFACFSSPPVGVRRTSSMR